MLLLNGLERVRATSADHPTDVHDRSMEKQSIELRTWLFAAEKFSTRWLLKFLDYIRKNRALSIVYRHTKTKKDGPEAARKHPQLNIAIMA
jgi:hypothetical protein